MKLLQLLLDLFLMKGAMSKSRKGLKALQEKKLRKMLRYAYDYSPYYRKAFAEQGINATNITERPLSDFPTIDKHTFMDNFDKLVTVPEVTQELLCDFDQNHTTDEGSFPANYHVVHSSGSTGVPRFFFYDDKAWNRMLLGIIRGALWDLSIPQIFKLVTGGIRVLYVAAVNGRYGGAMAVGGGTDCLNGKRLFLDVNTPLSEWVSRINRFNPNIIIGYPSALKIAADLAESGEIPVDTRRVISCGEPLTQGLRRRFETLFRAPVINVYGASESLALGVEVSGEEGMYLFDDLNYIEIYEDKLYLTSLYNFVQPLIRYHISDRLTLHSYKESDSSPFTRAGIVLSRDEDVMWFQNDEGVREFLHPLSIEGFCIEGLLDFQFLQTGTDSFYMTAQVSDTKHQSTVCKEMTRLMGEILSEKGLEYVKFSVKFVKEILPDPQTGKKPLIAKAQRRGV